MVNPNKYLVRSGRNAEPHKNAQDRARYPDREQRGEHRAFFVPGGQEGGGRGSGAECAPTGPEGQEHRPRSRSLQ